MDPLSITTGVLALLHTSRKVIDLISTINSASTEIRWLTVEISTTRALLSSIADIAGVDETWNHSLRELMTNDGPMQMLDTLLSKLEHRLGQEVRIKGEPGHLRRKLTWPWRADDTREMVRIARDARGLLAGALAVDHLTISKEIREETKQIHEDSQKTLLRQDVSEQRMVVEWLSTVDAAECHYSACTKHEEGTGDWLLESKDFGLWLTGTREVIWLYGIPGSGKTVHCSTIIEHVQKICKHDDQPVCFCIYYYFDFKDRKRQTFDGFIRSAIAQICRQSTVVPREVMRLYEDKSKKGQDPSPASLVETLLTLLKHPGKTYIILDALDECLAQKEIFDLILRMKEGTAWSANIMVTSRLERQIQTGLQDLVTRAIPLRGPQVDHDIQTLVRHVLVSDPVLSKRPIQMKREIEHAIVNGASGMFRLAACQLDALRSCLSPSAVRKTLQCLPQTLDEIYERILCGIDEESRSIALTALQFLTISSRPVNLDELSEMVAIRPGVSIIVEIDRLFDPADILAVCSSLVTMSRVSLVQLSHYSVRECLTSERICKGPASYFAIKEHEAHLATAQRCLTYLLSFDQSVISDKFRGSSLDESLETSYPLLEYATFEWHTHVRLLPSEYQKQTEPMILRLLDQDNLAFHHWLSIYRLGENENSPGSPLYYAAELGLSSMVRRILDAGADVNVAGGMFGSPLAGATLEGHIEVVRILLERGADVNIQGGLYHTPLQAACTEQRLDVFNLLLAHGADINVAGGYYGCALQAAAARGWPEAALHLVKLGADINIMAGQFGTGLQAASRYCHEELVMELLEKGADPNAAGGYYNTALQAAARGGHTETIQMLLEHGADVHMEGGFCGSALRAAQSRQNHAAIEMLEAELRLSDAVRSLSLRFKRLPEETGGDCKESAL
ncbi:hypothetical protein N7517_006403 [Penicillium concentricum]|uniref:NACHT domain-containing protein n=1 Tax=Penicillium concentricum TaxID=293559 RepID=A0A9W9VA35_9EURO|nr:uncharacterized protein N7517_006403 [Penicillium concentricum]KAJ5374397.1 hypothetical protein N7517_006403 [Penicillium concentricum]